MAQINWGKVFTTKYSNLGWWLSVTEIDTICYSHHSLFHRKINNISLCSKYFTGIIKNVYMERCKLRLNPIVTSKLNNNNNLLAILQNPINHIIGSVIEAGGTALVTPCTAHSCVQTRGRGATLCRS